MAEVSRYDEMTAMVAARLVASDLGVEPLDDRILIAFRNVVLPAHEKAVREQVARDIEVEGRAARRSAGRAHSPREDHAYRTAAHIARGGVCIANPEGVAAVSRGDGSGSDA